MNLNDIDSAIAELAETRKALIAAQKVASELDYKAIIHEFDWCVEWKDDYSLSISCRRTEACQATLTAWKEKHPHSAHTMLEFQWQGMKHLLIGNVLVSAWGGSIVLSIPRGYNRDYYILTDEQAQSLRDGIVPMELRKPW